MLAWCAALPAMSLTLFALIEPEPVVAARLDDVSQASHTAVVLLGSSIFPAVPGDTPLERIDAEGTARAIGAARVWRSVHADALIVTGRGPGAHDALGNATADLLVMHGVDRAHILVEPWSRNTHENALHAVRIGRRRGYTRYVVVTSALHMPRALREFRNAGVEALAAPVHPLGRRYGGAGDWIPCAWAWSATQAAVHELLGMVKTAL